jgi:hypothetical protein
LQEAFIIIQETEGLIKEFPVNLSTTRHQ